MGRPAVKPNTRLQQTGAPVPSSARVLIAAGDEGNVEFDSAGESPAADASVVRLLRLVPRIRMARSRTYSFLLTLT